MSKTITITLSDAQHSALSHSVYDPVEWIENFTKVRADDIIQQLYRNEVDRLLESGQSVSGTKDEIILSMNLKTAKQINQESDRPL